MQPADRELHLYYTATILSRLLAQREAAGDAAGIAELSQVAPVAWQHINLYGRYEFTRAPAPIDVDTMVAAIASSLSNVVYFTVLGVYANPPGCGPSASTP